MGDCIFCAIVQGDAAATVIRSWPDAIAIVPLKPVVTGHVLVLPFEHVESFYSDPDVSAMIMHRAAELLQAMALQSPAYNVITSIGKAATQTVKHLHVHLVPRRHGDGLALPWTGS